jgi:hypothetical protein
MRKATIDNLATAIFEAQSLVSARRTHVPPMDTARLGAATFAFGWGMTVLVGTLAFIALIHVDQTLALVVLIASVPIGLPVGLWTNRVITEFLSLRRVRSAYEHVRRVIVEENASWIELDAANKQVGICSGDWRLPGVVKALQRCTRKT